MEHSENMLLPNFPFDSNSHFELIGRRDHELRFFHQQHGLGLSLQNSKCHFDTESMLPL